VALDLDAVARALAAAVSAAGLTLNGKTILGYDTVGDQNPPMFVVGAFEASPHQDFGGLDEVTFSCWLLTARSDEAEGQRTARQAASMTGTNSVPAVVEAQRHTQANGKGLGGLCDDLVVEGEITGPGPHELGAVSFFGVKIPIRVMG
jgi:hypothetical protein